MNVPGTGRHPNKSYAGEFPSKIKEFPSTNTTGIPNKNSDSRSYAGEFPIYGSTRLKQPLNYMLKKNMLIYIYIYMYGGTPKVI